MFFNSLFLRPDRIERFDPFANSNSRVAIRENRDKIEDWLLRTCPSTSGVASRFNLQFRGSDGKDPIDAKKN